MKMLTIANHSPGTSDDFCWGIRGEIALPTPGSLVCYNPDCGCDRSHSGLNSHKASTMLMVKETELSFNDLIAACVGYIEECGWVEIFGTDLNVEELAQELVTNAIEVADQYAAGTVLRPLFDRARQEWRYTDSVPKEKNPTRHARDW